MTADIVNFNEYKYTKIAEEFVRLRSEDPIKAADYARGKVKPDEFDILSKYIDAEISRQRGSEPYDDKE